MKALFFIIFFCLIYGSLSQSDDTPENELISENSDLITSDVLNETVSTFSSDSSFDINSNNTIVKTEQTHLNTNLSITTTNPIATDSSTISSESTRNSQTDQTNWVTNPTPSPKPTSNFMKILIVILVFSIVLSLIICGFCCFCSKASKSKTSESSDPESGIESNKRKVVQTPDSPIDKKSELKKVEPKVESKIVSKMEPKEETQKVKSNEGDSNEEIKKEKESTFSMPEKKLPEVSVPTLKDSIPESNKSEESIASNPAEVPNSGTKIQKSEESLDKLMNNSSVPDEGKPSNPFEGFPDS